MWNYSMTMPSLMVMITLLVFYFGRRRLPIRLNRTFLDVLMLQLYVLLFDFLSTNANENFQQLPVSLVYLLNMAFFALFLARTYLFYRFTREVLGFKPGRRAQVLLALPFAACGLVTLSSPLTGAVFTVGADGCRNGPLYSLLYICFFIYVFASVALVVVRGRSLRRWDRVVVLAYNGVLLIGIAMRMLMPNYQAMDTFCMLAILIIYLAYLNPDLYVTDRGAAFNMRAFRAMLRELSDRGQYRILGFALQNYNQERAILGGQQMDRAIARINHYMISDFPNCMPFYLRGGRFALLSRDDTDWKAIQQRVQERFQQSWHLENADIYLSAVFAYVDSESRLSGADRIISNLILTLDGARQSGSAAGEGASLDAQQVDRQVDILRSLEQALESGQVEVFLQPVVDAATRKIAAAEALARIRDAEGKLIPPGLFIPIAEKSGYINQLGDQVFEKTCAFIRDHDMERLGLQWINVNLSPIQCMQRGLAERFSEILDRYHVSADAIHLEVTEQSMVDYALLQKQIQALRGRGFQFVLDDYGSGYSNLTRVKHYPFINIKLDMEVVWDYFRDRDRLLPAVVQGFKQMNFSITAEGIETQEMADALVEIGSDYLQGYLFSRPLSTEAFVEKYGA